ncbi:MAG: 50S ribosomal protein L23 [Candidatus Bostrichicola ureolyticus]|nr:MAG: 50S ribosomal protein L23 [Candidatus Bostrichicola ureolyticus]
MTILIKPLNKVEKYNRYNKSYVFLVKNRANKIQIKNEIEKFYNVIVKNVNTIIFYIKPKSKYTKKGFIINKSKTLKKAIITLEKGAFINYINK